MPEPHDHNRDDDLRPDPYLEVSWNGRIKKKRRRKPRRSDPASNPNWVSATDQFMGQNRAPFPQAPDYQSAPAQPHPQQKVQAQPVHAQQVHTQPAQQQVPPQQPGAVRPPQGPGGYQPARPRPQAPQQQGPPRRFSEAAGLQRSRAKRKKSIVPIYLFVFVIAFIFITVTNQLTKPTIPSVPTPPSVTSSSALSGEREDDPVDIEFIDLAPGEMADYGGKEIVIDNITDDISQWYDPQVSEIKDGVYLTFEVEFTNNRNYEAVLFEGLGWSDGNDYLRESQVYSCRLTPRTEMPRYGTTRLKPGESATERHCVHVPQMSIWLDPGYLWIDGFDEVFRWEVPQDALN